MTAQIPDSLLLQDRKLSIVGVNGRGLFDPAGRGLRPVPRLTSCWRGYVCTYKTLYNKFLLDKLELNLGSEGPVMSEVKPLFSRENTFDNTYADLNMPVDFSGGILAASDFVQQLYVHMGFHPAWKYRNVFELVLSQGYVLETRDVSEQMEQIRNEMAKSHLEPDASATRAQIETWVASTFKLDYKF